MLLVLIALAAANLIAVVVLLARKPAAPPVDPRLAQLPDTITHLQATLTALDATLRNNLIDLRSEQAQAAQNLRTEITGSIATLSTTLTGSSENLRTAVGNDLTAIGQRLANFINEANKQQLEAREALHARLNELGANQTRHLEKLNTDNAAKLEEMRQTVDEKLHATLQTRLTESFGQVTTHLGEVQKGLGEMKELATGVSDLKKVFSNVKSRGIVGEFQLGMQLEQMFSREQYLKDARIKPSTTETVEYALKFPSDDGTNVLLPIDAKFPREDWERLEHAYEHGTAEDIAKAGAAFERTIRAEGKRICEKYIDEPTTLPHAIMFLPTESLYAEVVRRPGLQTEVQQKCRVTIAGPSTFMAILTSFQMGFHTLAIQKKGSEVWKVLASTKSEFEKFGGLMDKVEKQVGTVQTTLGEINRKTKTINRTMREVGRLDAGEPTTPLALVEDLTGVAPLLAAVEDED
jgi:DNA recombination protein RmuC